MKIRCLIKKIVEEEFEGSSVDVISDLIFRELVREVEYEVLRDAENDVSIAKDIVESKIRKKIKNLKRQVAEEQAKINEINRFAPGLGQMNATDLFVPDFKLTGEFGMELRKLYWQNFEDWGRHNYDFWFDKHKDEILEIFKKEFDHDVDDEKMLKEYIKHTDIDDVDYSYLRGMSL